MIYDRILTDVHNADLLRKKMQSGQQLTEVEKAVFERGAFTVNTLNRIENKQSEISLLLKKYGYWNYIVNKTYDMTQILQYSDYLRILDNLNKLKNAFYIYSTTPNTPSYMYGYKEANDIEKILVDIENMISGMTNKFRECGTFQCGEENDL